ncbi:MAG: phosphonate metabolism protein/1,5-bisphosphokinase (PRPP-forming) PhnN [Granulosicoccus sp.]
MRQPSGCLIVVVGPSGAGKDSVLQASQRQLSHTQDVRFVQRVITREAADGYENHKALDHEAFIAREQAGDFCLTWQAHDLYYGVPLCVADWVNDGYTVILNGSRRALPSIQSVFPELRVVHLVVDDEILAQRLAARGRESATQIKQRLSRQAPVSAREKLDIVIHNNDSLADTVATFVAFIEGIRLGKVHRQRSSAQTS